MASIFLFHLESEEYALREYAVQNLISIIESAKMEEWFLPTLLSKI